MAMDIVIGIPFDPKTFFWIVCICTCLFCCVVMAVSNCPKMGAAFATTAAVIFITVFIIPLVEASMPTIPPLWQNALYTSIHPETWFNVTVVWSNGGSNV